MKSVTVTKHSTPNTMRSALKWAGGKKKLVGHIDKLLPKSNKRRLIEPFVGGGSVFLNLDFDSYLLVDMNHDLINLFNNLKYNSTAFIKDAAQYFDASTNQAERYYSLRAEFNQSSDAYHRSLLFLYLNRHGYNGLCRYNKSGGYNVPFGRYKKPYFPQNELMFLANKAQKAEFIQGDFALAFEHANQGDIIYCDPPYSPITPTASFTAYSGNSFGDDEQRRLVQYAEAAKQSGISTLISNHDVVFTQELYKNADKLIRLNVQRSISRRGQGRVKVGELLALYQN